MKFITFFSCLLLAQFTHSTGTESSNDDLPQVSIKTGSLQGQTISFRGIKVNRFLGIPFGEPLIGWSRFQKPIPAKPWKGVYSALKYGRVCSQPGQPVSEPKFIEDCLYLNVWESSSALVDRQIGTNKLRPVMVWIHGGGFIRGAANLPDAYDGTVLAALHDVIIVSLNYRLNQFGFLYLPEHGVHGNMGFWDQRLALQWVQDNIKAFGGDSNKVTVFGESAGSMSVSAHLVSSQSKGLYRNVIMQSGAILDSSFTQKTSTSNRFLQAINCTLPSEIQSCLSSYQYGEDKMADTLLIPPVIGDEFLPDSPENLIAAHEVDPSINVLLGTVGNEGASLMASRLIEFDPVLFDPYHPVNLTLNTVKAILSADLPFIGASYSIDYVMEKYFINITNSDELRLRLTKAVGDILITCPSYIFARDLVQNGHQNVFAYYQTQKPERSFYPFNATGTWLPATHVDDIPFMFGHSFLKSGTFDREEVIMSTIMMKVWANFAKEGEPGSIGGQKWSVWKVDKHDGVNLHTPTMEFNSLRIGNFEPEQVNFCFDTWPFKEN